MTLDHYKYNQNCNYFLLLYNHKVYIMLFGVIWSGAVVLNCGQFSLSGDIFDCYDWIGGCYWHLVGRGQGHW